MANLEGTLLTVYAKVKAAHSAKDFARCERLVKSLINLRIPTPYVWKHEDVMDGLAAIKKNKVTPKPVKKALSTLIKQWIADGEKIDQDQAETMLQGKQPLTSQQLLDHAQQRYTGTKPSAAPQKQRKSFHTQPTLQLQQSSTTPSSRQARAKPVQAMSPASSSSSSTTARNSGYKAMDAGALGRMKQKRFFTPAPTSGSAVSTSPATHRRAKPLRNMFNTLTLQNLCLTCLVRYSQLLSDLGDVPYHVVAPALQHFRGTDLDRIEENHPSYQQHTNDIWQKIFQKECRSAIENPKLAEIGKESWKKAWLAFHEQKRLREEKAMQAVSNAVTRIEQSKKSTRELTPSQHKVVRATAIHSSKPRNHTPTILKKMKERVRRTGPEGNVPSHKGRMMVRQARQRLEMKARYASATSQSSATTTPASARSAAPAVSDTRSTGARHQIQPNRAQHGPSPRVSTIRPFRATAAGTKPAASIRRLSTAATQQQKQKQQQQRMWREASAKRRADPGPRHPTRHTPPQPKMPKAEISKPRAAS